MRELVRVSGQGLIITVHPTYDLKDTRWCVSAFDKCGNWKFGSSYDTKEQAIKRRTELFKSHRLRKSK